MKIDIKVELNSTALSIIETAQQRALEMTIEAVLSDIKASAVVPKDTSMLEDSSFTEIQEMTASIIFDTPYARYLYYGKTKYGRDLVFRTDKNINAKGLWFEDYISGDKKQWIIDTYLDFLKQESGGLII